MYLLQNTLPEYRRPKDEEIVISDLKQAYFQRAKITNFQKANIYT